MGLGIAALVATLAIAKQPFKIVTLEHPGVKTLLSLNLVAATGTGYPERHVDRFLCLIGVIIGWMYLSIHAVPG